MVSPELNPVELAARQRALEQLLMSHIASASFTAPEQVRDTLEFAEERRAYLAKSDPNAGLYLGHMLDALRRAVGPLD